MKSNMCDQTEIIERLPEWIKILRKFCIELIKEQAPDEYKKLKKSGII